MSQSNDLLRTVGIEILKIVGSFIFGLLMRKKVGRYLIKFKRWLSNDSVTIDLVSTRTYTPVETNGFDMDIFRNIQGRIPNVKLDLLSHSSMRIEMRPFGIMKIILTRERSLDEEETIEEIKVSLSIENPIRLGIRETDLVHEYYHNTEIVFQVVEGVFAERPTINRNYTIAEISRIGGLLDEKTFEIDDTELSAHVHATQNKITIAAEPPTYIAKAVKKYLLR